MNLHDFSPRMRSAGRVVVIPIFSAIVFLVVGLIIAANLDMSPRITAQVPAAVATNIAQTGAFPVVERDGRLESPFVGVVERVQNAVVHVSARTQEEGDLPWWHRGMGYSTSSGSGFFFRDDGYILTNNHVIEHAEELTVTTASGYRYDARLVGADSATDLAVIKIEPDEPIAIIPFGNSDEIKVGDWAIAIGNPFPMQGLDRTVTVGVISAKGRSNLNFGRDNTPQYQNYIQTDASINPGNSGGPLLNLAGECIGVNAAISSPTGASVGIGFAIPINLARSVVPDLIATGRVSRGWLGVWLGRLTEQEARRQGLEAVRGVKIDSVFTGSPAARAGIKSGDIILNINNQPVENGNQLSVLVSQVKAGDPIPIEIIRNGEKLTVTTVLGDRDSFLASLDNGDQVNPGNADDFEVSRWLGMELMTFTPDVARALGAKHVDGVYVRRVIPGGPADNSSIVRGTIILQVNNEPIKSIKDIDRLSSSLPGGSSRIPLIVIEPDGALARKVLRP